MIVIKLPFAVAHPSALSTLDGQFDADVDEILSSDILRQVENRICPAAVVSQKELGKLSGTDDEVMKGELERFVHEGSCALPY